MRNAYSFTHYALRITFSPLRYPQAGAAASWVCTGLLLGGLGWFGVYGFQGGVAPAHAHRVFRRAHTAALFLPDELLHDPVFHGMEVDDGEPPARFQHADRDL